MSGRGGGRGRGWRAESLALASSFPSRIASIQRHHLNFINDSFFLAVGVSGLAWGKGWGNKTSMFGVFLFFSLLNPLPFFSRRL